MLAGRPDPTVIAFSILPAGLGDSYSMVAANFRTGDPPPAGRDEMLIDVDSPLNENTSLTTVKGWLYHVDFVTPSNSTIGIGSNHTPNALITVNPFVEAWTNASGFRHRAPAGYSQHLDTLGDKIMTPVVYQNLGGTESLWATQTVIVNFPTGPSGSSLVSIRCYRRQFSRPPLCNSKLSTMVVTGYGDLCPASRSIKVATRLSVIPSPVLALLPGHSLCRTSCSRPAE